MVGVGAAESVQREGLQPYGALDCFGWRSEGVQGGERKATLLVPQSETSAKEVIPGGGLTRRLPEGVQGGT